MEVPRPFFTRRWVQLVLVFLLGLGVFWTGVWATNGLRDERDRQGQQEQAQERRQALQSWKAQVDSSLGAVAQPRDPLPPAIGDGIRKVAKSIEAGKELPEGTADQLVALADMLGKGADALEAYKLSDSIRDRGFGVDRVNTITVSRTEMVQALRLYATAASLASDATQAEPAASKAMGTRGLQILDAADAIFADAWRGYQLVLGDAGLLTPGVSSQAP